MIFTFSNYKNLCAQIVNEIGTIKAEEIKLNLSDIDKWIVVKHDVETNVSRALKMAEIENGFGIKATYYVQGYLVKGNGHLLKKIASLGHEVTYHYDVLDGNDGDYVKAKEEFKKYLEEFRNLGLTVQTVCPHGNPLMNRRDWNSNKDFFRDSKIAEEFNNIFDIVVQLPKVLSNNYIYISDAGFGFKHIVNVETNDIKNEGDVLIPSISHFMDLIKEENKIVLSTHPHRWRESEIVARIIKFRFFFLKNTANFIAKNKFLKLLLSKFYFLAKKV